MFRRRSESFCGVGLAKMHEAGLDSPTGRRGGRSLHKSGKISGDKVDGEGWLNIHGNWLICWGMHSNATGMLFGHIKEKICASGSIIWASQAIAG